jgi:hypothetical protein
LKKTLIILLFLAGTFAFTPMASAITYIEDFEATFPAWESGWLGTNSNLQNYYGKGADRGNNPDGLWIDDGNGVHGGDTVIIFNSLFGASLTNLALDIAGWEPTHLKIYDMSNTLILDEQVILTYGAWTDPGVYAHYSVSSANGISKFLFTQDGGSQIEGNTSIDNVVAQTDGVSVPEPAAMLLLGCGLLGLIQFRRKFRK